MSQPHPIKCPGMLSLLLSLLLLWAQDGDGRSVKIGESSLHQIEKIATTNSWKADHTVPRNGSNIERLSGGGFGIVLGGRGEKFEGDISSSESSVEGPRITSVQYEETEENETERAGTNETKQAKEHQIERNKEKVTEQIEKPQQNETEETEVEENGETVQNDIGETEKVEMEYNMEEDTKESEKKEELESEQSDMDESENEVNMAENERKLESGEKELSGNQLNEWAKEMKENQTEELDTNNLENAVEERTKVESNEEDVGVTTDTKTNVTEGKEMGSFEEELERGEGEIMDSSLLNEKKVDGFSADVKLTELTVVQEEKEETDAKIAIPEESTIADINYNGQNDVILEGDEEDLMIARLNLLPIASALRVSIMSVDYYGETDIGMETTGVEANKMESAEVENTDKKVKERESMGIRDMEAAEVENTEKKVKEMEAAFKEIREMEAADMGSQVSVTVQQVDEELGSEEPADIGETPQKSEARDSTADENVIDHSSHKFDTGSNIEDTQYSTAQSKTSNGESSFIDLTLRSNQSGFSLQYVSAESRGTTEFPTNTSVSVTTQDTTTAATTKTTTTAQITTTGTSTPVGSTTTIPACISRGCKHLSSTLNASLSSPCADFPQHLCSTLSFPPPPPPQLASLLMANLTEDSMEHHLLSSCLASAHSTHLQEVVRAVLVRLPWTYGSSLKEKSTILARAFPKLGLLARLEHVEVDGREAVKIVPASPPLPHHQYLRPAAGSSKKVKERAKLLLEVATMIQTKQAAASPREESEMAGCRFATSSTFTSLIISSFQVFLQPEAKRCLPGGSQSVPKEGR